MKSMEVAKCSSTWARSPRRSSRAMRGCSRSSRRTKPTGAPAAIATLSTRRAATRCATTTSPRKRHERTRDSGPMTDERDANLLVRRVDALMRRQQEDSQRAVQEVPVLTEIVELDAAARAEKKREDEALVEDIRSEERRVGKE